MSRRIIVSDEYRWSAAPELFDWVVAFLLDSVQDTAASAEIKAAVDHQLPVIDLRSLPGTGREEILRALRERLAVDVEASETLPVPEFQRRSAMGHIKVLKLMADDLVKSAEKEDES
jgi:hypothetical protein